MEQLNEQLALVATIDPDSYAAETYYTDAIDMKYWERVAFTVLVGDMATGATVDFSIVEGTTTTPTTAMDPAKAITQLTQAGTDADKQAIVEVAAAEMDPANRYIRGKLVVGTDACDVAVVAHATGRFHPASAFDLASVDEIVTP